MWPKVTKCKWFRIGISDDTCFHILHCPIALFSFWPFACYLGRLLENAKDAKVSGVLVSWWVDNGLEGAWWWLSLVFLIGGSMLGLPTLLPKLFFVAAIFKRCDNFLSFLCTTLLPRVPKLARALQKNLNFSLREFISNRVLIKLGKKRITVGLPFHESSI